MGTLPQSNQQAPSSTVLVGQTNAGLNQASSHSLTLEIGAETLAHLTTNSVTHVQTRLSEFASQVLHEARAIEKTEHVGKGSPEITAAHIDEAWWVCRRRIRRSRHPILIGLCRIFEGFGTLAVSVGFTNLKSSWGLTVFGFSVVLTATAYLVEMQLARSD
jgi:hypothetical protein